MWEYTINTGNPDLDRQQLDAYRQSAASSGMQLDVNPLPTGGFHVRMSQPGQQAYQAPQYQQQSYQAPPYQQPQYQQQSYQAPQQASQEQMAFAGGGAQAAFGSGGAAATDAGTLSQARVKYLRKVYGLLAIACVLAIASGAFMMMGDAVRIHVDGAKGIKAPPLVAMMLENDALFWGSYVVLLALTFIASWTSRVKVLNVIMLFAVAIVMGVELAPMVYFAQIMAGMGKSLSANPVRDTFVMVGAIFAGITGYVFVTKKDFSYLGSTLAMGAIVVFAACFLGIALGSEIFSLAVASVGALVAGGFILYQTSWILRRSNMDDPVGDALVFIVQIRNLFMFILRILMSSRR